MSILHNVLGRSRAHHEMTWPRIRALHAQDRPPSRAYADILQKIFLEPENAGKKCFLVTSAAEGEGKTTTALNLAAMLAVRGKDVLLMDANFRRPTVGRHFNAAERRGLTDLVSGNGTAEDVIVADRDQEHLHLVTAGNHKDGLLDREAAERLRGFLKEARSRFDFVLIDAPSVTSGIEPLILGQMVDGVVLVVLSDRTQQAAVLSARNEIQKHGGRILGVVLNRLPSYVPAYYRTV